MGRCITKGILGSLCESLSDGYMENIFSTHSSLWGPHAVRCARSSSATIIDVIVLIHMWNNWRS
jgi:hypothetical protein